MRDRKREAWEHDLEARQRNIVFPDTVANEARFWRNLISGKQGMTGAKVVYLAIFCLTAVGTVVGLVVSQLDELRRTGLPRWQRIIAIAGEWTVALTIVGGLLLLIKWRAGKVVPGPLGK